MASLLAGEGAQVVKSEDGQVGGRGSDANALFVALICELNMRLTNNKCNARCRFMCIRAKMRKIEEGG